MRSAARRVPLLRVGCCAGCGAGGRTELSMPGRREGGRGVAPGCGGGGSAVPSTNVTVEATEGGRAVLVGRILGSVVLGLREGAHVGDGVGAGGAYGGCARGGEAFRGVYLEVDVEGDADVGLGATAL